MKDLVRARVTSAFDNPVSGTVRIADRNEEPHAHRPPHVLVVDDDPELRASLARMLAECDLVVIEAANSLDALTQLQRATIDVVVADQSTWGIDGVSLLSTVRDRWPAIQRVLLLADAAPDIMVQAVNRAGIHKVVLKTMHALQIRDEIERVAFDALK